jgi:hypothetical protein
VVFRKTQGFEVVVKTLDLRAFGDREAEPARFTASMAPDVEPV